jgi:hypothetical protein
MANDKTYDRHVNIWINGKEVVDNISNIKSEMVKLTNEVNRTTRGTDEYYQKVAELKRVKQIFKEHQDDIKGTTTAWDKLKGVATSGMGFLAAGVGGFMVAWKGIKSIIESTDAQSDKFEITLGGLKGGLDALKASLASINEGGLKNLVKNIREGFEEGQRYAQGLDNIDEKTRALQIAEAEANNEILRQTEISRSAKSSKDEQIAAGKKIIEIEETLTQIRTGIAQQAYLNESQNIQTVTHLTEAEILAYAKTRDELVANLGAGKEYNKMIADKIEQGKQYNEDVAKYNQLYRSTITATGQYTIMTKEQAAEYVNLGKKIDGASEETKRFALAIAKMPGDDKMKLLTNAYNAYQVAIGSGLENTMKTRIRTANNEDQLNKQAIKGIEDKTKAENAAALESVQIDEDVRAYTEKTDKDYFKALDEKTKKENAAALESAQIAQDVADYTENLDKEYFEKLDKKTAAEEEYNQKLLSQKQKLFQNLGGLENALFDAQFAKLDAQYKKDLAAAGDNAVAKAKIEEEYTKKKNALSRRAAVVEKIAALFSIGIDTAKGIANAASKVVTLPLIPWIVANGVLQAAIVAAKPVPQYAVGGYTKHGGKYEPAGIVHAGEWIANADMVASPVTGPVIRALEDFRANNMPGYANGGMAMGGSQQGPGGGSAATLISTDPELKILIRQNSILLAALRRDGVNMKFGYIEADNVRKGLDKLSDIEDKVAM